MAPGVGGVVLEHPKVTVHRVDVVGAIVGRHRRRGLAEKGTLQDERLRIARHGDERQLEQFPFVESIAASVR